MMPADVVNTITPNCTAISQSDHLTQVLSNARSHKCSNRLRFASWLENKEEYAGELNEQSRHSLSMQ
jgi:hypothetical protein